jgi:signal transduction histidine kinase
MSDGAEMLSPMPLPRGGRRPALLREVGPDAGEDQRRALLMALREPVITTSPDGRVTGVNPAAAALFGGASEVRGQLIGELLPFLASVGQDRDREPDRWQGRVLDGAGRTVDLEVSLTRLADAAAEAPQRSRGIAGDPAAPTFVYLLHDVSHHTEVARLREQLLFNVAHELRGPLTVLGNALEILAADFGDLTAAEADTLLGQARRTTGRLRTLLEELLSVGTIQAGHFVVTPHPTELGRIMEDALDLVAPSLEARHQHAEVELGPAPMLVQADRRYARQVLSNLLTNASKYGPEGSVIRVTAEPAGGAARVTVADRGPGIAPEHLPRLFEPFYRVRADDQEAGVGLGLAIAKGIVEAHGGRIDIDSAPGAGTRVWFTLPMAGRRHAAPDPAGR